MFLYAEHCPAFYLWKLYVLIHTCIFALFLFTNKNASLQENLAHFCYLQKHHYPDHTSSVCFSHFDIIVVTMLITVLSARLDIY